MAGIRWVGQGGVGPSVMGLGPVPAIRKALKKAGLKLKDMELIELNEAFAAQSLGVVKELSEEHGMTEDEIKERTNLFGGAIALGHPIGATGTMRLVTLLGEMQRSDARFALETICGGGGQGICMVIERK